MVAQRCEISLQVLKKYFSNGEERNLVSPSDHVMLCLSFKYQLYKYHSEIVYYLTKAPAAKGANHCVTITTVIFSHMKITCYFHV